MMSINQDVMCLKVCGIKHLPLRSKEHVPNEYAIIKC
jgi:hypothetical protein